MRLVSQHRRRAIAGAAVVALIAGGGTALAVRAGHEIECAVLEADSVIAGIALAQTCDADVEVVSERTPWQRWWTNPQGGGRFEASTLPDQVKQGDSWVPLDTSFVRDSSSDVVTLKAAPYPISFSNGIYGAAGASVSPAVPLGQLESDAGDRLKVWFPLPLPHPDVTDDKLTYDLGDGIRLVVSVTLDGAGFLPIVELADKAAAEAFTDRLEAARDSDDVGEGMDIGFRTEVSDGLHSEFADDGMLDFVDPVGAVKFEVAPPSMWDSSGQAVTEADTDVTEVGLTDRTVSPAAGDHISPVGLTFDADTILLAPDMDMVTSPDTEWPIYIDPNIGTKTPGSWIAVRSGGYTDTLYKWGDISSSSKGQGTGYCNSLPSCNVIFHQRLAWRFDNLTTIAGMDGADISSATFRVYGAHSANCTNQETDLFRSSNISASSTYSSVTAYSPAKSRTEYHSLNCSPTKVGYKEFSALPAAQWIADHDQNYLPLMLRVAPETSITTWKRFAADAKLEVVFNRMPVPSGLQISGSTCTTGPNRPFVASLRPTMSAVVTDPDLTTVSASFVIWPKDNTAAYQNYRPWPPMVPNGSRVSYTIPATQPLIDGQTYVWHVGGYDGEMEYYPGEAYCEFTVDVTPPVPPTITPVTSAVPAVYYKDRQGGGVSQPGKFVLDRGSSSDVNLFKYSFTGTTLDKTAVPGADGKATIDFPATAAGPVTLTVQSFDIAGNFSPTPTNYSFTVATPTEDGIWTLDEGTGSSAADSATSPGKPMTVSGATWGDGPHTEFDSRPGDFDLVFDGTNDVATTDGPVVDTSQSFAVSAHVKLDAGALAGSGSFTALSQDGTVQSGFELGYSAVCDGMPDGCWQFSMPDTREGSASTVVNSSVPVTAGEWTHLFGSYDASSSQMWLWTCEVGTPSDPAVGEPIPAHVARGPAGWAASGSFVLARGFAAGYGTRFWPGAIDNVRVFTGEVASPAKIRRLCQGAEASDFSGGGTTALDPTEAGDH